MEFYPWIKTLHIVSVIAWMAGLLYLPRLFVYHAGATPGGELSDTLKIMERRLLRTIMTPAMLATWIFGIWVAALSASFTEPWLHAKLLLVLGLTVLHMAAAKWRKDFEADRNKRPARFYRWANEIPAVLMLIIVILVVVKPF